MSATWKKMYEQMAEIAGEALSLADHLAYSQGDSETVAALIERMEELELKRTKIKHIHN